MAEVSRNIFSEIVNSSEIHGETVVNQHEQCTNKTCEDLHRPRLMIKVFCLHWLTAIAIAVTGIIFTTGAVRSKNNDNICDSYFLLMYLQVGYCFGTYAMYDLTKPSCQRLLKNDPILYYKLASYRKRPLQIVSFWKALLIFLQQYSTKGFLTEDNACARSNGFALTFMTIFIGLETASLSLFYFPTLIKLWNYSPNAMVLQPTMRTLPPSAIITLHQDDSEELKFELQKSADQLRLEDVENTKLRKRVEELTHTVEASESTSVDQ
ncbi:uncharacterized protein LOC129739202 [Uranotaenia lowii]|uniref:uncharacterized protein LOC129739202 n=1 Tax=Uranotaenia lowii TaxID=190385 RepID=UPI00247A4C8A|nr:uncharacterized protein LOC129739202 [Uranotaenia lowii]